MALASKLAKGAMERTKKFLGLPGYDDITELSQKEVAAEIANLKKIEKSRKLTAREEKSLDRLMNRTVREAGAEKPEGMSRAQKAKPLSEREKKGMQESLEYKKGGMVKKMAKGGMSTANYAKGGMSTANCGASMKPTQKAKK